VQFQLFQKTSIWNGNIRFCRLTLANPLNLPITVDIYIAFVANCLTKCSPLEKQVVKQETSWKAMSGNIKLTGVRNPFIIDRSTS
jgi:hypothetical protein